MSFVKTSILKGQDLNVGDVFKGILGYEQSDKYASGGVYTIGDTKIFDLKSLRSSLNPSWIGEFVEVKVVEKEWRVNGAGIEYLHLVFNSEDAIDWSLDPDPVDSVTDPVNFDQPQPKLAVGEGLKLYMKNKKYIEKRQFSEEDIKLIRASKRPTQFLALLFDVNPTTINNIKKNRTYKDIV